jgi:hypothetical protein
LIKFYNHRSSKPTDRQASVAHAQNSAAFSEVNDSVIIGDKPNDEEK